MRESEKRERERERERERKRERERESERQTHKNNIAFSPPLFFSLIVVARIFSVFLSLSSGLSRGKERKKERERESRSDGGFEVKAIETHGFLSHSQSCVIFNQ